MLHEITLGLPIVKEKLVVLWARKLNAQSEGTSAFLWGSMLFLRQLHQSCVMYKLHHVHMPHLQVCSVFGQSDSLVVRKIKNLWVLGLGKKT